MLREGKPAIITGAGSGVGRASALRFVEEHTLGDWELTTVNFGGVFLGCKHDPVLRITPPIANITGVLLPVDGGYVAR